MDFERIWEEFGWVIGEMREGMGFFEGYMPALHQEHLREPLSLMMGRARVHTFQNSVWSDEAAPFAPEESSLEQRLEFFGEGRIVMLCFDYEVEGGACPLALRLNFEKEAQATSLNVICYREPVLNSAEPREAIRAAIDEMRTLQLMFGGDALFIGPDASEYPRHAGDTSGPWLRIA